MLLSHPDVAEAVAFGAPDEKYGEVVAAAVVLHKPSSDTGAFAADLRKHAGDKLSAFKVRSQPLCTEITLHACLSLA